MSEIAKLYENAGVNKIEIKRCSGIKQSICLHNCNECESLDYTYLPFTPEKQLELIKWLGELDMLEIVRTTREDKAWIINSEYGMSGNVYEHTSRMKSFEEAIAGLINSLWQDLTDADKVQIKEILE